MTPDLLARYSAPVPRYTSYPTAPHFHTGVDAALYADWLSDLSNEPVSLYLHIPFCNRLCWYCGCQTKQVRRYEPVADYLDALCAEIALVATRIGRRQAVSAIHLGGGSPTILSPDDVARLRRMLDRHFEIAAEAEISVEIDPAHVDAPRLEAWSAFGMNRASLGIQDFHPAVQVAINRPQSFEQTAEVVAILRRLGIRSINVDIVYGLPLQTREMLLDTVRRTLSLGPDRIAMFGYAHVPWMRKHQSRIDVADLADASARFDMAAAGAACIVESGFRRVGIDHFARPQDPMAQATEGGNLRRNFQGYTTDGAETLIGLGASSIGRLPQGYVQNLAATGQYSRLALAGSLPVQRGFALSDADRAAGCAIEALMCRYAFSLSDLRRRFGRAVDGVAADALRTHLSDADGFTRFDGDVFSLTEPGRPFVRSIAAKFDRYLGLNAAKHSVAV